MGTKYDRITTTIEREWLAEIIAGKKKIEYRQIRNHTGCAIQIYPKKAWQDADDDRVTEGVRQIIKMLTESEDLFER